MIDVECYLQILVEYHISNPMQYQKYLMIPISQQQKSSPSHSPQIRPVPFSLNLNIDEAIPILYMNKKSKMMKYLLNDNRLPTIKSNQYYMQNNQPKFEEMSQQQQKQYWLFRLHGGNIYNDDYPHFYYAPEPHMKIEGEAQNDTRVEISNQRKTTIYSNSEIVEHAFMPVTNLENEISEKKNAKTNVEKSINKQQPIPDEKISIEVGCLQFNDTIQQRSKNNLEGKLGVTDIVYQQHGKRFGVVCSDSTIKVFIKNPNYQPIPSNKEINESRVYIETQEEIIERESHLERINESQPLISPDYHKFNMSSISMMNQSENQQITQSQSQVKPQLENRQWLEDSYIEVPQGNFVYKVQWFNGMLAYGCNDGTIRINEYLRIKKSTKAQQWQQIYRQDKKVIQDFEFKKNCLSHSFIYITADGYLELKELKVQKEMKQCIKCYYTNLLATYLFDGIVSPQCISWNINYFINNTRRLATYGQNESVVAVGLKKKQEGVDYILKIWENLRYSDKIQEKQPIERPFLINEKIYNRTQCQEGQQEINQQSKQTVHFFVVKYRHYIQETIPIDTHSFQERKTHKQQQKNSFIKSPNDLVDIDESDAQPFPTYEEQIIKYPWKIRKCYLQIQQESTINCIEWAYQTGRSYHLLGVASDTGIKIYEIRLDYDATKDHIQIQILKCLPIEQTSGLRCLKLSWNIYGTYIRVIEQYETQQLINTKIESIKEDTREKIRYKKIRSRIFFSRRRGIWVQYRAIN